LQRPPSTQPLHSFPTRRSSDLNYDGGDLTLHHAHSITMKRTEHPELQDYLGHTLITTDGTTLLGADNKAGIAEIMTAMEYLIQRSEEHTSELQSRFDLVCRLLL